ncbi:MAG: ATP-binding protein [Rhizobiaceae bacterium]
MNLSSELPPVSAEGGQESVIGSVLSCRGSEARIGLTDARPLAQHRATVGKFIAIRSGGNLLLGIIAEVSAAHDETSVAGCRAVARVDLMGEITRGARDSRFRRGVREYPAIGDEAVMISRDDLRLVYSATGDHSIAIGHLQQDATIPAYVDVDSLLSKHFAVLGSTGVGKSSGVAVILGEVLRARPDVRILLLDVHNEYGNSFGDKGRTVGAHNLKLPFWLFNFEEFTDVVYAGRPAVPEEVEILAELIPVAKATYMSMKTSGERSLLARKGPRHMGFTADTPSPYLLQDLLSLIDERMGKLENRSTRMVHHRLMMRLEGLKNDPRYAFMFENANVGGDTMAAVLDQLFQLESEIAGITVLKLASLPGEVLDAVVCVTCRLAFEFGLWSDGAAPLLITCEEAHRYAAADHSTGFAPARRALSRIAKEGRKYGVYLGLVTQRPAELDPTIISQCSTLFVMRMANEEDQTLLRSVVSDAAANLLSFVPSLGTGEVVGIGEGMPLPARLVFRMLPRNLLPASETAGQGNNDARNLSRGTLVRQAIERWRKATTSQPGGHDEDQAREASAPSGVAEQQDALERGLQSIVERAPESRRVPLDPARYSILKR